MYNLKKQKENGLVYNRFRNLPAERSGLLLAILQMYRLVRENLKKGGCDYVHSIIYHRLVGFCVPDVRARQARKILIDV